MTDDMTPLLAQDSLSTEAHDLLSSLGPTPPMPPGVQVTLQSQVETIAASPATGFGAWPLAGTIVLGLLVAVGVAVGLQTMPGANPEEPGVLPQPVEMRPSQGFEAVRLMPQPKAAVAVAKRRLPAVKDSGGLAEELRLLRTAKRLLSADPQAVLQQVELHEQRFPSGQLADMRDYLRLRGLVALGRPGTAAQVRGFLDKYPNSTFRKDVLRLGADAQ